MTIKDSQTDHVFLNFYLNFCTRVLVTHDFSGYKTK